MGRGLMKDELEFYLDGVLFENVGQLQEYENVHNLRKFWLDNKGLFHTNRFSNVSELHLNKHMNLIGELKNAFFDMFLTIERLAVNGPVELIAFKWILKNATALRELTLVDTWTSQKFMEALPSINCRLTHLKVNSKQVTDFNFILKFEQLEVFETNRPLASFDLVPNAFQQLTNIMRFCFAAGNEYVAIDRPSDGYRLSIYSIADGEPSTQTFHRQGLHWTELVALYDQWRAGPTRTGAQPVQPGRSDPAKFWARLPRS